VFLGKFWSASAAKGREGFLPYLILKGGGTMEVNGLAYFRDDKMVGVTEPYEITTYMGILGLNPAGGDRFVKLEGSNDYILVNSRSRKSLIKTEIRNGKPHFTISISVEANVLEKSNSSVQLNNDTITKLEQQVKQRAKKSCSELIEKTKGKGSDIFGFGERIRANYPKYWNQEIKTKENWQSMYKEITYDISVSLHIRRIGMKSN
jgi:spore germination protein KC